MSCTVHGTCSICSGAVTTPTVWMGIFPPTPTCSSCGAVPASAHGPVIPMAPARPVRVSSGTDASDLHPWITQTTAALNTAATFVHAPQRGLSGPHFRSDGVGGFQFVD